MVATPVQSNSRMNLKSVVSGKLQRPVRVVIHGTEGVGKTTFAADAPRPIFLCAEDGTAQLSIDRFPEPGSFAEVAQAVTVLETEPHDYQTLVIDTVDWLEPLIWRHVCAAAKKPDIESFGYGKGYVAALDVWRSLVAQLDRLRTRRGMHVILVAHSWVRSYNNPEGENFDRFELKLNNKAAGLLKEWCDAVLFASFEQATYEDGNKHKGISTGARIIRTERRAAFDAKNRYRLPFEIPLSWAEFWKGVRDDAPDVSGVIAEVRRLAVELGVDLEASITNAGGDAGKLAQLADWARGKLRTAHASAAGPDPESTNDNTNATTATTGTETRQ